MLATGEAIYKNRSSVRKHCRNYVLYNNCGHWQSWLGLWGWREVKHRCKKSWLSSVTLPWMRGIHSSRALCIILHLTSFLCGLLNSYLSVSQSRCVSVIFILSLSRTGKNSIMNENSVEPVLLWIEQQEWRPKNMEREVLDVLGVSHRSKVRERWRE